MSNNEPAVSLDQLIAEADQHRARIRTLPASTSVEQAMIEIGSTVLPMVKDLAAYIKALEEAVIGATGELGERLEIVESDLASSEEGTRFDAEDAARFLEFIGAAKILADTVQKNPGTSDVVRDQLKKFMAEADELTSLVEAATVEDDAADEEGEVASEDEGT